MSSTYTPVSVSNFKPDRPFISRVRVPFNDQRRYKVWAVLTERIKKQASCVVQQISKNRAESVRFYRFLSNPQVSIEELIHMNCQVKSELLEGRHVLVLGDTTSWNLKSHVGRIRDRERIGVLDDNKTPGFMTHVHLALDASSQDVLGISDVLLWSRPKRKGKKVPGAMKEWEDKESYKWALGIDNASRALQKAARRTFVLDRDADNYELFLKFQREGKSHFVIRSRFDRQVQFKGRQQLISECLPACPCLGTYTIELPALDHYSSTSGKRVKRQARKATIEVRATPVTILPPCKPSFSGSPGLPLYLVEAREISPNEPEPIVWQLLTSHPADTFEQAMEIIRFYLSRWVIEQLFRTSKTEGFNLEATELETFDAIQRQTVMVLHAAAKVLQLVYARSRMNAQPIAEVFNQEECAVLSQINQQYQGTTEKQKNPYPESQTSWATWIIARLGGWKGYESQRPPGPITLKRGLEQFYIFLTAFQMLKPSG